MTDRPAADPALEPAGGHVSPIPRAARAFQGQPAGIVTRIVAAVLDALVVGVALLAGYLGFVGFLFLINPRSFQFPEPRWLLILTIGFVVSVVYLTVAWAVSGRTYGDLVMGLRVLGPRGRDLRLAGAAARALLVVVFPIGLAWVPVGRGNRSLQDVVLRTRVVYDWQPRGAQIPGDPP